MGVLKSIRRAADWVTDWLSIAMFFAVFLVVLAQIFYRYFLRSPLVWTEELSRAMFIWVSLIGWILATRNGTHISIMFIANRLPKKFRKMLMLLFRMVAVAFLAILGGLGAIMTYRTMGRTLITIPGIPIGLIYLSLPLTALLGIFYTIFGTSSPAGDDAAAVE